RPRAETFARSNARLVFDTLATRGALFAHDLQAITELLPSQLEDALSELAALGLVTSDGFACVRLLVAPHRPRAAGARWRRARGRRDGKRPLSRAGRWSL